MNRMLETETFGLFFHILLMCLCFISPSAMSCQRSLTVLLNCWSQCDLCFQVNTPPCSVKCLRWVLPGQPGHCRTQAGLLPGSCPHPLVPAQHPQLQNQGQHSQMWLLQQNLPAASAKRKFYQIAWADLRKKKKKANHKRKETKNQFCSHKVQYIPESWQTGIQPRNAHAS